MTNSISSTDDKNNFDNIDDFYQKLITTQLRNEGTLYIIIGSDNGEFYKQLKKYPNPDGTRYLFIELASEHQRILEQIGQIESQTSFIVSEHEWKKAILLLKAENYIHSEKVTLLKAFNQQKSHENEYAKLFTDVKNDFSSLVRGLKSQNEQLIYLDKKLQNIVDNILPAQLFANQGKGTALILGAGPSLDTLMPWIKQHRDQVTLIAVSRIYQQLSYEGIEPEIFVSVDPQPINYQQSKAMLAAKNSILVHSAYVSPQLLAQWNGVSLYLEELFPWKHKLNQPNLEVGHPTVSHTAVKLAMAMGYDQILLAGIDLCYANDGGTHSGGHTTEIRDLDHTILKTYKGESAETSFFMRLGITQMEEIVKSFKGNIYNLSENAAVIKGIEFNDSPILPESSTPLPEIHKPRDKQRLEHLNMLKKELSQARKKYSEIKKLCKEAIKLNINPAKLNNLDKFEQNQVKIDKIEHKFNTSYKDYTELAKQVVSEDFLSLLKQSDRLEKSVEERHEWIGEYYDAYLRGTKLILSNISYTVENLANRLDEFHSDPDITLIIEKWHHKNIPGRSCIFLEQRVDNFSSKFNQDICTFYCQLFKEQVSFDREFELVIKKISLESLSNYTESEIINFQRIINRINNNASLVLLSTILTGVLEQLQGNHKSALQIYMQTPSMIDLNIPYSKQLFSYGIFRAAIGHAAEIDLLKAFDLAISIINKIKTLDINDIELQWLNKELEKQFIIRLPRFFLESTLPLVKKYFDEKNLTETKSLLQKYLTIYPNPSKQILIKLFLQGIINQIEDDLDKAAINYSEILDIIIPGNIEDSNLNHPLLEPTLLQMLTLSEKKSKVDILLILNEISNSYLPELAQSLEDIGEIKEAIFYYQQHLTIRPDDLTSFEKIHELYIKTGMLEQASIVADFISVNDQNNNQ